MHNILVQNLSQVALLGPETTSDDGLVGDYARRRPAAAAFGAAATSTTLLQQRGACKSCCTSTTSSHLGDRWWGRLRPAGLSAPPPTSCQEPAACDTGATGPGRSTSPPGDVRIYRDGAGGANNGGGVSGSGVACAAAPPPANPTAIRPTSRQGDRLGVYGHSAACASLPPQPWRGWRRRPQAYNSGAEPPALCRTFGTAASNCQEPAACDTGVAGPRRSTFSLGELVYFGGAGGGNDGSDGDSGGASCAAAPPLRSGSGLLQQAVGSRLIVVGSQSAAR